MSFIAIFGRMFAAVLGGASFALLVGVALRQKDKSTWFVCGGILVLALLAALMGTMAIMLWGQG